jgi:hypothetical protein
MCEVNADAMQCEQSWLTEQVDTPALSASGETSTAGASLLRKWL